MAALERVVKQGRRYAFVVSKGGKIEGKGVRVLDPLVL